MNHGHIVDIEEDINSPKIVFAVFLFFGVLALFPFDDDTNKSAFLFFIVVSYLWGAIYFLKELINRGILGEIFKGILLAIFVIMLSVIPIIGQIILLIFILSNIAAALGGLKNLMPLFFWNVGIYGLLLFGVTSNNNSFGNFIVLFGIYFAIVHGYCFSYGKRFNNDKDFLFQTSTMLVSLPLVLIILVSIASMIRSLFQVSISLKPQTVTKNINVQSYMRGDTLVSAHTRTLTSTVSTVTQNLAVNPAIALTSSTVNSVVQGTVAEHEKRVIGQKKAVKKIEKERKIIKLNKDKLLKLNNNLVSLVKKDTANKNVKLLKNHVQIDNPSQLIGFQRFYDEKQLNDSNIPKMIDFISEIKKYTNKLENQKILAYFDNTDESLGNNGLILTDEFLCVFYTNFVKQSFLIKLSSIQSIKTKKDDVNHKVFFCFILENDVKKYCALHNTGSDLINCFNEIKKAILAIKKP